MVDVWAAAGRDLHRERQSAARCSQRPQVRGCTWSGFRSIACRGYRDSWRPSEWSLVLAHSYARFLCRENNAASAEIIRHTREPVGPDVLMGGDTVDLSEIIASFGEKSE